MKTKYKILRADRAARDVKVGEVYFYSGHDFYGLCNDDYRATGLDHIALSASRSGEPFFTIPSEDVEALTK